MSLAARIDETERTLRDATSRLTPTAFASSFGVEDMVVLDLIARFALDVEVFTLDTGRLHEETLELIDRARQRYRIPVRVMTPDSAVLETFVAANGVNAFYRGIELRKACCAIRKMQPLARALAGKALWITGLRREQAATRSDIAVLGFDAANGLMKLNPLADWTSAEVWSYARQFDVPVNPLHARGFPSIGCAPCTRAVQPGEDPRAGRWWWESPASRECGLHVAPDGGHVRARVPIPIVVEESAR